jgi:hypothetical protein
VSRRVPQFRRIDAVLAWCSEVVQRFGAVPYTSDGGLNWRRAGDDSFRIVVPPEDDTVALDSVAQELEASGRYTRAEDAIRADTVMGPHLGKIVGDPDTGTSVSAEGLLFGAVLAAARQPNDMRAAVRTHIRGVRDALAAPTRRRRLLAPLPSGFSTDIRDRIEFDVRTSLVPLDDTDIATALDAGLRFRDDADGSGLTFVGTPWAIDVTFEVPVVSRDPDEEVPDRVRAAANEATDDANARVLRAVQALRLTKPGPVSTVGLLQISEDPGLSGRSLMSSSTRLPRPPSDAYLLEEDDVPTLRSLVRQLGHPSVASSPALRTAIGRLSSSTERHDAEDRVVDLIVGAEALFADDERDGDLELGVAQRFARFVAPAAKRSVMDLFDHMKLQYEGRSYIVHAKRRTTKNQRKIDRAVRGLDEMERFMRLGLRRALNETVDRGAFAVAWDRLVLEGEGRGSVIRLPDARQPVPSKRRSL